MKIEKLKELKPIEEEHEIEIAVMRGEDGVDENGVVFPTFKRVMENNKLVDLKFKKDVDLSLFDNMQLFTVVCVVSDATKKYLFPRYYASKVNEKSIHKIR